MEYISLHQAQNISGYSQDYLRLRARQGKLKSLKFGNKWVTKKEWVDDYLIQVAKYKKRVQKEKPQEKIGIPIRLVKAVLPPENLPIAFLE